jgi:hypothetical protein
MSDPAQVVVPLNLLEGENAARLEMNLPNRHSLIWTDA